MAALGLIEILLLFIAAPFWIAIAGVIMLAAHKMRKLENYGLAMTACILAMLPCHPGFMIGLPIGLWTLLVLQRPEVKAAFDETKFNRS